MSNPSTIPSITASNTVSLRPPELLTRRALVMSAAALALSPARAWSQSAPEIAALKAFIGDRGGRVHQGVHQLLLNIPRIADNGNSVPLSISFAGPVVAGHDVRSIHLFSEKNPVTQVAVFYFPTGLDRIQVESRIRLAGTQRLGAVATLADGTLHVATADVIVTISACIDGS